jgi:hypothetical protein
MRKVHFAIAALASIVLAMLVLVSPHEMVQGQEPGTAVFLPAVGNAPTEPPPAAPTEVEDSHHRRRRTPTATPGAPAAATPAPGTPAPTATMDPHADHDSMVWHAPGSHGLANAHEHGDAPPQWVVDYVGGAPTFHHVAGTPNENGHDNNAWWKHTSFKGWAGRFSGVDWYGIFHLDFNPSGHPSRFHSYQIWFRDGTGAVSAMHGWLDFGTGNNTGPQIVVTCGNDSGIRPIMKVNSNDCPANNTTFENWYARASGSGGWAPDVGFNINSNYRTGGDPADPSTWSAIGGVRNLTRRIEFAWYANRSSLRGTFWTDQWGIVMSGADDQRCGQPITVGDRTYTRICLQQYIAPSLTSIEFPGNAIQRNFPGNGVQLPN